MILSIITINLNNAVGLCKTIKSIVTQNCNDFEYIIIDGGSTDGSVEVIKKYSNSISYWVSEPDKGIFNAMNKGIRFSNGKFLLFINSGDYLADCNILNDFISANFHEDIISGNMILCGRNDSILIKSSPKEELSFEFFYKSSLPHPATFIKRELFYRIGIYNEDYEIISDWEFFLKAIVIHNCTYNHFERVIAYFDDSGISCMEENGVQIKEDREKVLRTHIPYFYKSYKSLKDELDILRSHEIHYREYMNLKNGKCGFLIMGLLNTKEIKKRLFSKDQ